MRIQFRKRIRLLPFLWLNFGKKGLSSVTIGRRGLSLTIQKNAGFLTLGATGSGLSVRNQLWGKRTEKKDAIPETNID
ncbi:DUF4236 domain-containing protein [Vibrio sonorensis]|uniref:DUF4236 domain-containing protein n=1 Tax=Vibrio sonorensis TaxID=1004316 RepID=UPI0008DA0AA7|nr:DUF4236 domain-containing protein [Vibrio sonorensis]